MTIDSLRRLLVFVVLVLVQALVLGRIQLFHCATPLLYVYFAVIFPRGYPKWASLLWCFAMGMCIDMFANTPGLAAASMTLAGALQPYLLELFMVRDAEPQMRVAASTLGNGKFATLTTVIVLLYCLVFFALETFNFYEWQQWLMCTAGSTVLTVILIFTIESIRK